MIGTTLSHFKITAKLGEGGMGEVYRAEDTKLGREVAIKVLPEAVAADPERLARFEREAKVLASLNHPHIAAIYSFEAATVEGRPEASPEPVPEGRPGDAGGGAAAGGRPAPRGVPAAVGRTAPRESPDGPLTHFLVMELVQGMTLRDRLVRGPLSLEEGLPIALQIAQALEAAHGQGIIHRDLKPANVMVDDEGNVKVLDFGLAKALDPMAGETAPGAGLSPSDSPLSLSPTLTAQMTGAGVLLGTASYMSPEQARGKKVDKRADVWAFGVVLWEMLTGQRLFEGETVSDTLAGVLRAEPEWERLAPATPRSIHRLLRRCLEKNPKDRLHDIADARLEIEEAIDPSRGPATAEDGQEPYETKSRKSLWVGLAGGLALGAVLAVLGGLLLGGSASEDGGPVARVASVLPEGVIVRVREHPSLAISPDGQRLVFVGTQGDSRQLYQRLLSQFEWQPLPGTEGAEDPFFSPDGQWVAFFAGDKLKKVSLAGGSPQVLCDAPNPYGGSWGPQGKIAFWASIPPRGLKQVSELGGVPEVLTSIDGEQGEVEHNWPQWLADGRSLIFTIWKGSVERSQVAVQDLESGEKRILTDGSYGRVTPSGHLLYALADGVYVVPFDLDNLEISGPAVPIPEPIYRFADYWLPSFALASNGTMVYQPGRSDVRRQLVAVGLDGSEAPVLEAPGAYMYPRLSPDGSRLVVDLMEGAGASISIIDLETGTQTRLTREGNNLYPLWTPDGERILFSSDRSEREAIYWQPADGSGPAEELVTGTSNLRINFPSDISPDGRYLVLEGTELNEDGSFKSGGIFLLSLEEPRELRPLLVGESEEEGYWGAVFSPDGHWIAYVVGDAPVTAQIFVQGFPEAGGRRQVSTDWGLKPQWSPDGKKIYYRATEQRLMAASVTTEPAFKAGVPELVFEDRYDWGTYLNMPNFTIAPDSSKLIMIKPDEELGKASEIRIVFNWLDELEGLVPGGAR